MTQTREQKKQALDELKDICDRFETVAFVEFDALKVARSEKLRDELYKEDVTFRVVKKTLLEIALSEADVDGEVPELPGQIALAYGGGVTASARGIDDFEVNEEAEKLAIVGGIFDGEFKDQAQMQAIAQIPGLSDLRGMFVNAISSPISGFALALNERASQSSE
jgi:large subunit ribosomal protein L10